MSLQVWLPLNGSLENQGLTDITIINNGATVNNTGKIGQCYYFNASSYLNESTYNWTNFNTTEFSLCCWYKEPSPVASGNSQIICIGTNSGWNNIRIGLLRRTSNGYPMFSVSDGSNAVQYNCTTTTFSFDTWNHIACTYNNGEIKIYLNGILNKTYTTTIVPVLNSSQHLGIGAASNGAEKLTGYLNDVRIYDHCLSQKEIEELAKGLILHYKLDSIGSRNGNPNLGNTSANYSNQQLENPYAASSWGGDAGTVTYYKTGGYNNLPYKVYHKTATGTSGIYRKTADDIIIEEGKTYTFSCWIKSNRNYTESAYGFNINRGSGNYYINYGTSLILTTDWKFFTKTFTATAEQAGNYGEMSIIYDDAVEDYYVYYSGFKIEEGIEATPWVNPIDNNQSIIYDSSGYNNNGTAIGNLINNTSSARYDGCLYSSTGANDRIVTPSLYFNNEAITLNIWFKSTNTAPSGDYHMVIDSNANRQWYEMAVHKSGYFRGGLFVNGTRYAANCSATTGLNGNWHMLTLVYDKTAVKRYFDGALGSTSAIALSTGLSSPTALTLFRDGPNATYACKETSLSDFRIYATALTDTQILELYNTSASIDNNGNVYTRELVEI